MPKSYKQSTEYFSTVVDAGFTPTSHDSTLTMDGTAQVVALAERVNRVRVLNLGVTSEAIRVAFGQTSASAEAALNISSGAATTGFYIGAAVDGFQAEQYLGVPDQAAYLAVANAVALDTQSVIVAQGV